VTDLNVNWRVKLGNKTDYGIGSIGCGGIVQYGHMPAYQKAGFKTVAAYDLKRENAEQVAAQFGIPNVYDSVEELLADPAVEIVDIAVPPWVQLEIVEQVVAAGKHMLCQKPLALDFNEAKKIVELGERAGLKQAINQQMRWDAGIAASNDLISRGFIGKPAAAEINVTTETPWHMWPWLAKAPRLEVVYHSIHYLDSLRFLFGEPEWVTSRHARYHEQGEVQAETKTVTVLDYASGLQAIVSVNHYNIHGKSHATFTFLGTEGAIEGTIGLMYNYPDGRPDTMVYRKKFDEPIHIHLDEMWIPDAFVGPMACLMEAVEKDEVPCPSTRDNLNTLRIIEAAYLSARENRSVRPEEIE